MGISGIGIPLASLLKTESSMLTELHKRGLLSDCTDAEGLTERLKKPITVYCGFDPTGDSLHVGHLMGLLALRRFQLAGHRPIVLAGGATGMIGDPSGKSQERNLLTKEKIDHNITCITPQLQKLLDFDHPTAPAILVNNASWTEKVSLLDFLRDIGKHFSISSMLARDSVKGRLGSEAGISFTEFSYMLLQAFDFLQLNKSMQCELQVGGSDQWGNITAGLDLIRKVNGAKAFGLTFPLIVQANGVKFGKTETGTVWLDPVKTTPYKFFQFFLNTEDSKVIEFLQRFTFLTSEEIKQLEDAVVQQPERRWAQKVLARNVTALVHGEDACQDAIKITEALFNSELASLSDIECEVLFQSIENFHLPSGTGLTDALVTSQLFPSKSAAKTGIAQGAVLVNGVRVTDIKHTLQHWHHGRFILLTKGKKAHAAIRRCTS